MESAALALVVLAVLLTGYAYAGYPLLLWVVGRTRRAPAEAYPPPPEWPSVSVTVPVYNEEREIAHTLDRLLELDYPAERLQVLVVSDASTDRTDAIVKGYADRGVKLLRMPARRGKTAAENAAQAHLTGEIVVNTDASIRLAPGSLKRLVAPFSDPSIGVASGRDISVSRAVEEGNAGEAGYVGYEMWVRDLETRVAGIVGASGCCYAIRAHLHRTYLPEGLSRDFASALVAREHGYRAVSVPDAVCYVPRTADLRSEYRRKVRTMTRGMETLAHKRALLDPFRYGWFAVMLWSHKICRWGVPWALLAALAGVGVLGLEQPAAGVLALSAATLLLASVFAVLPSAPALPRALTLPAYLVLGNLAAVHAGIRALHGDRNAVWEPTRRLAG